MIRPNPSQIKNRSQLVYPSSVIRYKQLNIPKTGISDKFFMNDSTDMIIAARMNRK